MSDLAVIVGDHNIDDSIGHRYLVEDVIDHPDYGRNRTLDAGKKYEAPKNMKGVLKGAQYYAFSLQISH